MKQSRFLMCPPTFFGVEYVINPWMEGQIHATNNNLACAQWQRLQAALTEQAAVASLPPVRGLPDLVFTANAALLYGRQAVLSSFRFRERQPESQHFASWLRADGFEVHQLPPDIYFEGAGDALFDRYAPLLWLGHGQRSDIRVKAYLERILQIEVKPLRLRNPSFYHLDTCFCPLEGGHLLYYPGAFDNEGNAAIEARVPANKRIPVSDDDALHFACNAVNLGGRIVLNAASTSLLNELTGRGFHVTTTALTEFIRAGGAAKCLSLRLDEPLLSSRNGN
jgi:N-dimethylarginine dimethylaminohydrolase